MAEVKEVTANLEKVEISNAPKTNQPKLI